MPTILSESLEHTIVKWAKKFKLFPILLSFFLVIFTLLFMRDLATRSIVSSINGQLPYPGLMPDSPLYQVKRWRDDFLIMTTRDPVERALFYRHVSDKAVNAAQLAPSCDYAVESAVLSSHYLQDMRTSLEEAQSIGMKPEMLSLQHTKRALLEHEKALANVLRTCKKDTQKLQNSKKTLTEISQWFSTKYQIQ